MINRLMFFMLLPLFLFAQEPKTLTPFDANVTTRIQIVNKKKEPTAENGYYENRYYYETNEIGSAVAVFGLGHLFNMRHVIDEYKSYFRPSQSTKYQYEFEYADEIEKQ